MTGNSLFGWNLIPVSFFLISVHLMETSIYIEWLRVTKSKVRFMEIILSKEGFVHSYSASRFFNCSSSFHFLSSLPRFLSSSFPGSKEKMITKDRRNEEQTYFPNETSLFTEASLVICSHCLFSLIKMINFVFMVLISESCFGIFFFRSFIQL